MAKQHRMALLTAAALIEAIVPHWGQLTLFIALGIIALGCLWTAINRTRHILRALSLETPR